MPMQHLRPARAKKRKQSPVPALPIVVQLMEMGFPRRNIELALKSLTGASGNAAGLPGIVFLVSHCPPTCPQVGASMLTSEACGQAGAVGLTLGVLLVGVEALVGWLLDHADTQVTDLSDADTGSEDCSDEELVEDLDDMAYAVVSAVLCCPPPHPLPRAFPPCAPGPLRRDAECRRVSCASAVTSGLKQPCPAPGGVWKHQKKL